MSTDGSSERENEALVEQAKAILDLNWTGEYTQPGPRLYPHQWSWDSALIAIAYAHYDRERAEKELRHLFEAQWTNGLLPQIVFNPRFRDYFPGPSFWNADESPHAPKHKETSGVVLPPVHATAVLAIYKAAGDEAKEFLGYAFRKLKAWHEYLYRDRDPLGEGLVYIRHPWESGMDNSPIWDQIMQRMHLRAGQIPQYKRADTNTVSAQDRPTSAPYCATKGGVRMLMRTLAVELAPHAITANNIAPGAIETPMDAPLEEHPDQMKELLSEIPLGRMGKPEGVANLALFLASDDSSYVTGSTLFVDGGMIRHAGTL